ncbi:MAG: hypothetical protein MUE44_27610 [Oscillatoriaceae cyanobacterium Prado104]|jgi:hypothetical protein|nr:hypothetical protein [Oscillatoriaceae cyanobacterium Prado104]
MTIQGDVSHGGTQLLTRSNASKYALGWLGLGSYVQPLTILDNLPKPNFWFGDIVKYSWFSDDKKRIEWETGQIMGVTWHPEEKRWLYSVNWTESTNKNQGFTYPAFDDCLTDDSDFKLVAKGKFEGCQ